MREMKDSKVKWLGVIPLEWKVERVKHGFIRKKAEAHQDNPIVLSLARTGVRERDISNNEGQIAESYYNYNPVDVDDLLINPMDLYSGANCSISKISGVISPAYVNLRYREGYNPQYYDYYFKLQYWLMAFFAHGKGVSYENRWTLNAETLMNYPIIVPTECEQRKIVDYLDAKCSKIDEIIERQQVIIEKLKEYKLSIITEAVTKGLNPDVKMKNSGYEYIGDIPNYWNVCRLRNYGSAQNGISKGGEYFGTGFPFVSYGDVYRNYVLPNRLDGLINTTEEERKKYSVEEDDIFFTRTSETIEEVGFSAVCNKTIPNATYAGFVIRVRPFIDMLTLGFAKYYFRSKHLRVYFAKEMNLVTRASLGQDLLKSIPLLVPPKDEQCKIAEYLDKKCNLIDSNIYEKGRLIIKLQEYKKSLIYEVVTGKKEV